MDRTTAELIFLAMCVAIGLLGAVANHVITNKMEGGDDDNQG